MKAAGKVQVVVRSRRVPLGTALRNQPIYSATGVLVGSAPNTYVPYTTSLDGEHQRAIAEAQRLACNLGLGLEVVDESRSGIFGRILSALGGSRSPTVLVPSSPAMAAPSPALSCGS